MIAKDDRWWREKGLMDLVKKFLTPSVHAGSCRKSQITLCVVHGYEYEEHNGKLCYDVLCSLTFKSVRN